MLALAPTPADVVPSLSAPKEAPARATVAIDARAGAPAPLAALAASLRAAFAAAPAFPPDEMPPALRARVAALLSAYSAGGAHADWKSAGAFFHEEHYCRHLLDGDDAFELVSSAASVSCQSKQKTADQPTNHSPTTPVFLF